jgi:hypothetical protein
MQFMHDLVLYGHNRLHYRFISKICMYTTVNKLINILRIIQTQILNRYRQEWEQSGSPGFRAPSARA